jgi:hypothetical protein
MVKRLARKLRAFLLRPVEFRQEQILIELGRMQAKRNAEKSLADVSDAEFQVFSQHAEDGILQYLISRVPIADKSFVEFGVQDYRESNTRFLLVKDHWRGLIIDAGRDHLRYVGRESWLGLDHDLKAVSAFITRDNIDSLLAAAGMPEDLGLLSVDIDGNDYWVFGAISRVKPRLLVLEYNSFFGPELGLSVPYQENFERMAAHPSGYYFGASLRALSELAAEKGYALVGCESHGVNAFFLRRDLLGDFKEKSVEEAFVGMSPGGGMGFPAPLRPISGLPLQDPKTMAIKPISEWFSGVLS